MLYYTITVRCPHCDCPCPWAVRAEVEPPSDAAFRVVCPNDNSSFRVPFRYFKPAELLPPDTPVADYPPTPPQPLSPLAPKPPWWRFWKS